MKAHLIKDLGVISTKFLVPISICGLFLSSLKAVNPTEMVFIGLVNQSNKNNNSNSKTIMRNKIITMTEELKLKALVIKRMRLETIKLITNLV